MIEDNDFGLQKFDAVEIGDCDFIERGKIDRQIKAMQYVNLVNTLARLREVLEGHHYFTWSDMATTAMSMVHNMAYNDGLAVVRKEDNG